MNTNKYGNFAKIFYYCTLDNLMILLSLNKHTNKAYNIAIY